MLPDIGTTPLSALCLRRHFEPMGEWIREVVPFGPTSFGEAFPTGSEYRKHWEIAQAARTLAASNLLNQDSEILGVGAGNEPTIFWLSNYVKRVFATDLYLADGWEESANKSMLIDPTIGWEQRWDRRRIIAQHMDALDLRYPEDTFDGAFSSSSIEHFGDYDDIKQSIREVYRVLKPGGVFTVSTEFRLSGPPPGLPNILMFDAEELRDCVTHAAPWELIEPLDLDRPDSSDVMEFSEATATVRAHVAEYGEIVWDRLHWPWYPAIALAEGELQWTSVHLALRKPR